MKPRTRFACLSCAAALLGLAGAAPAADASFVAQTTNTNNGTTRVEYVDIVNVSNQVTIADAGGGVMTITDTGTTMVDTDGPGGCTVSAGGHTATCPGDELGPLAIDSLNVVTGDGNDAVSDSYAIPGPDFPASFIAPTSIDVGSGADFVSGSPTSERIFGGAGNDTLFGNDGGDFIFGQAGNDTIDGGNGADRLGGGDGTDAVSAGFGDDDVAGGPDGDTVNGGPGDDTVTGDGNTPFFGDSDGPGNDVLNGDAGDDTMLPGSGDDTVNGGDGDDFYDAVGSGNGSDAFNGGPGLDEVDYGDAAVGVTVTADGVAADDGRPGEADNVGADVEDIDGSAFADRLTGNGTDNGLFGSAGDDVLDGAGGDDVLDGAAGRDSLTGGGGRDLLDGGAGVDFLAGGAGDDLMLDGNDGDPDVLDGGDGSDTADYSARTRDLTISLDGVANDGGVAEGDDVLAENVLTGSGRDTVTGSAGRNIIDTGPGDDAVNVAGDPGQVDDVSCGSGIDTASADDGDAVAETGEASACETVNGRPANESPAAIRQPVRVFDTTAPKIKVKLSKCGPRVKRLRAKGCTVTVTANERFRVAASMVVRTRRAKLARAGDLVLASKTTHFTSAKGRKQTVRLRPSKSGLAHVPRRFKLSVQVQVFDRGGNRRAATRTVMVRR